MYESSVRVAVRVPPRLRTRSDMLAVPEPAETGARVGVRAGRPLLTAIRSCGPSAAIDTSMVSPQACLAALVRHSCTTR